MKEFKNANDFYWYKKKLDLDQRYENKHYGEPERYPCRLLKSELLDEYYHTFIYQQEVVCPECGHKQLKWPEI